MPEKMWITVEVQDGMFPTERTITLQTAESGSVSLFASADHVKTLPTAPGRGVMEVRVLDYNDRFALVDVPSQNGSVVKVELSALRLAS